MALGSVANILLQITGDESDGERALEDIARDLALFAREEAEAVAYVDTDEASRELRELKVQLSAIDGKDVSAEVNVQIAKAQADITTLEGELEKLDGKDVTVDVDVRRGVAEKLGSLAGDISKIGKETDAVNGGALSRFVSKIGESASGASFFGVSLGKILLVAPFVISALIAVAGQIFAVVASAASAVGGLGALAVAFGSTLLPAVGLVVGAIAKFSKESDTAGTAAHALAGNFKDVWNTFQNATAGGANEVFQGISDALRDIDPLVEKLRPAFTRLGEAVGDAFRTLGEHFSSPAWSKFFVFVTDSLAKLTPLFARSFGAFSDILRNIATAAMPFLIAGLRSVAEFLEGIADKTSDMGSLRDVIGGMVHSLGAWLDLLGGAADLVGAFVEAFAPFGDGIVESLAEGAHHLAEWIRSGDGLERIKTFFEDTGPVAAELGRLLLNTAIVLIQIGQFFAPLTAAALHALNSITEAIIGLLDWLTNLDRALTLDKVWAAIKSGATAAFNWVKTAASDAFGWVKSQASSAGSNAFGWIKTAAGDAFDWLKTAAGDAFDAVFTVLTAPIRFELEFAQDLPRRARDIWEAVKGVVGDVVKFVLSFPEGVPGRARNIWQAVKGVISDGIHFVLSFVDGIASRARSIWSSVKDVISDAINFIFSLPGEVVGRARDLWSSVKGVISDAIEFVVSFASGIVDKARALWDAINNALPDITIDINIPKPSIPGFAGGVADFSGGLAMVGEMGPELTVLPSGADVYTAAETKSILRALARGIASPVSGGRSAVAGGGGGGGNTYIDRIEVTAPGTGSPDPEIAVAKLALTLRARGNLGSGG